MKPASKLFLLLCALHLGCESSESDSDDDDDVSGSDSSVSNTNTNKDAGKDAAGSQSDGGTSNAGANKGVRVGEFSLKLTAPEGDTPGFTALSGKVSDGPIPTQLIWDKKEEASGCILSTPRSPFCSEGCGSDVCVEDDKCQRSPKAIGVGKVTVTGAKTTTGETEFVSTADPNIGNNYQLPRGVSLAYPAFDEGASVKIAAPGEGAVAAFSLETKGIAPLVLTGATATGYPLDRGKGLTLGWMAKKSGTSRIQVKLDISHHGGAKGAIECDVEDNGSLIIPASLTDKLLDLGVAGFPTVTVTRSSTASTETAVGRVDLRLYMYVETAIAIEGLISCSEPDDCPSGKSCKDDKTCG